MNPSYRALAWCLILLLLLQSTGCTRRYFRKDADKDVAKLLEQKSCDTRWSLDGYYVYPNPEARFGDTSNPDRPPMPPDDFAARELSPNPQKPYKKSGVGLIEGTGYLDRLEEWDALNRAERAEQERAEQERQGNGDKKNGDKKNGDKKNGDAKETPKEKDSPKDKDAPKEKDAPKVLSDAKKDKPAVEGMYKAPDDALPGAPAELSPQQVLARAEGRARREFAEVVTVQGPIPEADAEKKVSTERTFLIKLEQAVELGLLNSREYQTRREQVYLAALPVSLERFAFCPQFFAAETAFYERFGRQAPNGPATRWTLDTLGGVSQLFSTGGLLLLSFANRTIFNLTNQPDTSVSTLSLDLIQPLLRGAGRAVTLEPLTQAERNLLYTIRDFAKFKQDFYVYIAGGQPNVAGVNVAGGTQILAGSVTRAPLLVPNGVPVVRPIVPSVISPQVTPGDAPSLGPVGVGAAPVQGFLSTVIEKAQLVNQYRNIVALQRFLQLFRVYLEGGIVDSVQVGDVEQTLLQSVERTLTQQANYRTSVDQFKLQLGLPMCLRLEVTDDPLQPMFDQTRRYENISNEYEQMSNLVLQYGRVGEEAELRGRLRNLLTSGAFVRQTRFRERVGGLLGEWAKLARGAGPKGALERKLETLAKERDGLREKREQLKEKEKGDLSAKENSQLEELDLQIEIGRYERAVRTYEGKFWEAEKDAGRRLALQNQQFTVVYRYFLAIVEEAFRERQETTRKLWPELPPLCVEGVNLLSEDDDRVLAAVSRAALENRLDLMNARAQLVDSWRKICVAANALLGTFNVQYHVDWSSPASMFKPFAIGGSRTRHQAVIDATAPLVRIQERNAYRSTLIAYQQQRRALQQAEDEVLFDVRSTLRQLRASAYSYHNVQKRSFELAYIQVDQALQAFSQPQQPSGPAAPAGSVGAPVSGRGGGDPAALTQQLLRTQNSLLNAQNSLYNTWIGYLINRISLYRDLGLMQLDPRGVWIDDVATCHCPPASCPAPDGKDNSQRPTNLPAPHERPSTDSPERLPAPRADAPAKK